MNKIDISLKVNGKKYNVSVDPMTPLLQVIREEINLKGTKEGCGEGECGACSVLIDGKLSLSCLTPAIQTQDCEITTIENEKLTYIQDSFADKGAVQCGFCIPGFIMSTHNYIENGGDKDKLKIKHALSGNFCRCTGYQKIVEAVEDVIDKKNGDKK